MSFSHQNFSYYSIPEKYDTVETIRGKKLSESQLEDLDKEIHELFEQQIVGMNAKKMQFYEKNRSQSYFYRKKFICSPWMRGFCFFRKADCIHAHGVDDLVYTKDDFSYDAQAHYEGIDIKQLAHNLNYIHLYEFSRRYNVQENNTPNETEYTLEAINFDRTIRTIIREHTRTKVFEDFFLLLRRTYNEIFLTEGFIVHEFCRIGVGSDALGFGVKIGRIGNYLKRNLCYVAKAVLPCSLNNYTSFYVVKEQSFCLHEYFKNLIIQALEVIQQNGNEFTEPNIKQQVKNLQGTDLAPSFEIYLVQENMCLFRYFKFYATTDVNFLYKCLSFVQVKLAQEKPSLQSEDQDEEDAFEVQQFKNIIQFDCCSDDSEKTKRKNRLYNEYLATTFSTGKKKLCRNWLRGLCIFNKDQCQFSHGILDLQYQKYDENIEDPDYLEFVSQKPLWKERSYVSLFNEQEILISKGLIDTISTQHELNQNKELREKIREKMQVDAMEEFLEKMWQYYGRNTIFTRSLIIREFKRVGFFKIGYTLKDQMILDILSQRKCYSQTTVLPPLVNPIQVYKPFPKYIEVVQIYGEILLNIFQETASGLKTNEDVSQSNKEQKEENYETVVDQLQNQISDSNENTNSEDQDDNAPLFTINEYVFKKVLYRDNQTNLPPPHLILKYFNKKLEDIIQDILGSNFFRDNIKASIPQFKLSSLKNSIQLDSDIERLSELIETLLIKKSSKIFINYQKLFDKVYKVFRSQIRASSGFSKFRENLYQILNQKHTCQFFNMGSKLLLFQKKVFQAQLKTQIHSKAQKQQSFVVLDQYVSDKYTFSKASLPLNQRIQIIDSKEGIIQAKETISKHQFIGVDLEGILSKHGKIELIQISCFDFTNNYSIIYVFDSLSMEKDPELFELSRSAIQNIMEDPQIVKILQGCNKDALALFHLFKTKIINGIDTQVIHNAIGQLQEHLNPKSQKKDDYSNLKYYNSGLNVILSQYQAPNGLNPLKTKFQTIFQDHKLVFEYMTKRPINEEFLLYSSKDVEDLIPVYFQMIKIVYQLLKTQYKNITINLVNIFLMRMSDVSIVYKPKVETDSK